MIRTPLPPLAIAVLAALATIGGCQRSEAPATDRATIGDTTATAQRAAEPGAGVEAPPAPPGARDEAARAAPEARGTVADEAISAVVIAHLARDSELGGSKIDVDTREGRVVLRGSAPTREARERAARLATGVDGVLSVDNQLVVKG